MFCTKCKTLDAGFPARLSTLSTASIYTRICVKGAANIDKNLHAIALNRMTAEKVCTVRKGKPVTGDKINSYKEFLLTAMSKERYIHSLNVADMCVQLAQKHAVDETRAYVAGILHDVRKEANQELLRKETANSKLGVDIVELQTPKLWHAVAGAYFCQETFCITDWDIINAIRFHTISCANMTKLGMIVYLADLVSVDRTHKEVEAQRKMAFADLDNAMYYAVRWSMQQTFAKEGRIPHYTFEAYNYYQERKK